MQPTLSRSTIAYGILVGALFGAAGKAWGQDDGQMKEDSSSVASSLLITPPLSASTDWLQDQKSIGNLSKSLLSKSAILGETLDTEGKGYYLQLLRRTIDKEKHLALVDKDASGAELVDNLLSIAVEPIHPRLISERQTLLKGFIHELANPGELNQASWSVCGTAALYRLYLHHPSEAARLLRGLISVEGRCRLQDGSTLERSPFSLLPDTSPGRSPSERLLMSALMERANGQLRYCSVCDSHFEVTHGNISHIGLTNAEICVLYKALFNKEFSWMEYPANSADTLIGQLHSLTNRNEFVPASIRWNQAEALPQTFRHPKIVNEEQHESKILISQGSVSVKADGYHHILVTALQSGRVFFRNLHGKSEHTPGAELTNPPRRVEDPAQGIESMSIDEFKKRISTVYIEKN